MSPIRLSSLWPSQPQTPMPRRWARELENDGAPKKKSKKTKESVPPLTEKTIRDVGTKRNAK